MKANTANPPPPGQVSAPAEAVTALYRAHALGLIRLAVVMLGDRPAAEDVVQEAFCGLCRRWHGLSAAEPPVGPGDLRVRHLVK
jgi:DNA-directed RNA polymerase specialized sigma24 family protein